MSPDPDIADDADVTADDDHGDDDHEGEDHGGEDHGGEDHGGEDHGGEDHDHHEPDRALVAALKADLAALTAADLDLLLAAGDMAYRTEVMRTLKVKLNPRFLKAGMGRLLRPQVGRLADRMPAETADLLLLPPLSPVVEELLGDRYDDPSPTDVAEAGAALVERFGPRITRAYLLDIAVSDAPAAAAAGEVATTITP